MQNVREICEHVIYLRSSNRRHVTLAHRNNLIKIQDFPYRSRLGKRWIVTGVTRWHQFAWRDISHSWSSFLALSFTIFLSRPLLTLITSSSLAPLIILREFEMLYKNMYKLSCLRVCEEKKKSVHLIETFRWMVKDLLEKITIKDWTVTQKSNLFIRSILWEIKL